MPFGSSLLGNFFGRLHLAALLLFAMPNNASFFPMAVDCWWSQVALYYGCVLCCCAFVPSASRFEDSFAQCAIGADVFIKL